MTTASVLIRRSAYVTCLRTFGPLFFTWHVYVTSSFYNLTTRVLSIGRRLKTRMICDVLRWFLNRKVFDYWHPGDVDEVLSESYLAIPVGIRRISLRTSHFHERALFAPGSFHRNASIAVQTLNSISEPFQHQYFSHNNCFLRFCTPGCVHNTHISSEHQLKRIDLFGYSAFAMVTCAHCLKGNLPLAVWKFEYLIRDLGTLEITSLCYPDSEYSVLSRIWSITGAAVHMLSTVWSQRRRSVGSWNCQDLQVRPRSLQWISSWMDS